MDSRTCPQRRPISSDGTERTAIFNDPLLKKVAGDYPQGSRLARTLFNRRPRALRTVGVKSDLPVINSVVHVSIRLGDKRLSLASPPFIHTQSTIRFRPASGTESRPWSERKTGPKPPQMKRLSWSAGSSKWRSQPHRLSRKGYASIGPGDEQEPDYERVKMSASKRAPA